MNKKLPFKVDLEIRTRDNERIIRIKNKEFQRAMKDLEFAMNKKLSKALKVKIITK